MKSQSVSLEGKKPRTTVVLVTNQFACERIIKAGRLIADITGTQLQVLNVQNNEYEPNPQALEFLYKASMQNNAEMSVFYSDNTYKTMVHFIKYNAVSHVVSGMPSTPDSVLHQIWRKFTHIAFFTVKPDGVYEEVGKPEVIYQR